MSFTPKNWQDSPSTATPINASGLIDLEERVTNYALPALAVHVTVTGNAALVADQLTPVNATSGEVTMTLPAGEPGGSLIAVEKTDSTSNAVTIQGSIRGEVTSITLKLQHETVVLEAESSGSWRPLASHKTLSSLEGVFAIRREVNLGEVSGEVTLDTTKGNFFRFVATGNVTLKVSNEQENPVEGTVEWELNGNYTVSFANGEWDGEKPTYKTGKGERGTASFTVRSKTAQVIWWGTELPSSAVSSSPAGGVPAWKAKTAYMTNTLAAINEVVCICKEAHTSGESFTGLGTKWEVISLVAGSPYVIYPDVVAAELGVKVGEDYSSVFQHITEFIRTEATAGTHTHFRIMLREGYTLNGNPVTTLGGNSIWPWGAYGDTPCIVELDCAAAGTTFTTTRTTDTYSTEHGEPSILGGPTNAQMGISAHFSPWRMVINGILYVKTPNNPAIGGANLSRISFLGGGRIRARSENATATEPSNKWALGVYLPEGDNSAEVVLTEVSASGFYVGVVANSAHTNVQSINCFNNYLNLGITGNTQYSGNDGHSSFVGQIMSQESTYHVASWSPTEGVISLPEGHPAQFGWGLLDIEDHHSTEPVWYSTKAHIVDAHNQLTGGGYYGRVQGDVGRESGGLKLEGAEALDLKDITRPHGSNPTVERGENKKLNHVSLSENALLLSPLSPVSVAGNGNPYAVAISPDGKNVYVSANSSEFISQYERNTSNGKLTPLTPPTVEAGKDTYGIAVSPDAKFVYVTNFASNTVSVYTRNEGGFLTLLESVATAKEPIGVAVSPDGKSVYVTNNGEANISQYERNATTGVLKALGTATVAAGTKPRAIIVSPDSKFVYAANQGSTNVSQYERNTSTGELKALSTPTIAAGTTPLALAISSDGLSVYVANFGSNTVSQYERNATTGKLTALTTASVACEKEPIGVAISPDGKSVYVTCEAAEKISEYERPESHELKALTPATVTVGKDPVGIVVSPDNKSVYVAGKIAKVVYQFSRRLSRTVANTSVTANSEIFLTPQDENTTGVVRAVEKTAGVGFTITSTNPSDTGVISYLIVEPAFGT
jgi:DNA-binding beta-propeller fold protein YncE